LLIATAIFMVICGAMFTLLQISQEKYAIESQMSGSFQEARLGLDQMVRDINISGYPTVSMFANTGNASAYAIAPFAWSPGYTTNNSCQLASGGSLPCNPTPSDQDLIIETNPYPANPTNPASQVSWIRYVLSGNTLYRGVVAKTSGMDPNSATSTTSGVLTPFVNNVQNYATGTVLTQINATYPNMFPSGVQPPIFTYTCSTPSGPQPCLSAGTTYSAPQYISDVDITLIVTTPQNDMQTGAIKVIELTGRGHRTNAVN
jgi:hypothetical protein